MRKKEVKTLKKSYKKIQKLETYNKTLCTKNDELSAFQHDFNNIVQTIGGLLAIEKYDSLKRYYKELKLDCQTLNDIDLLNSSRLKNPEIQTLLSNKYILAKQNGIRMNLEINTSLKDLNTETFQIIRILGILLDNAIEACKDCEEKIINIEFENNNNTYSIIIENSFINNNINTSSIFKKGFSTKNGNTGLGLWKVNKIIKHNKKLNLITKCTSQFFIQNLYITI